MATVKYGQYEVTDSSSAPTTTETTRWPAFTQKEDCIAALCKVSHPSSDIQDIIMRLSNTDTSTWTNKGSIAR